MKNILVEDLSVTDQDRAEFQKEILEIRAMDEEAVRAKFLETARVRARADLVFKALLLRIQELDVDVAGMNAALLRDVIRQTDAGELDPDVERQMRERINER